MKSHMVMALLALVRDERWFLLVRNCKEIHLLVVDGESEKLLLKMVACLSILDHF